MSDGALGALQARVELLEAREEIRDLIATYSLLIDHGDLDAVAALFTDDCVVDFGIAPVLRGRDALRSFLLAAASPDDPAMAMVATSHHNADVRLVMDGPTDAHGTVSLYAWHRSGAGTRAEVWGYYFDRYEWSGPGWRFGERVLKVCGNEAFTAPWTPIDRQVPK